MAKSIMTVRGVPREITEAALRILQHTYADYLTSQRQRRTYGRILITSTALGSYDAATARRQACYLRMVSIVEAYVDVLYRNLFVEKLPNAEQTVHVLIEEIERRSRGWGDRIELFRIFHDIRFQGCASWKSFEAGTHVRNTIAHGLGRLTVRQQRNSELPQRLASIDVGLRDDRLVITERSLTVAFGYCRSLIKELDERSGREPASA